MTAPTGLRCQRCADGDHQCATEPVLLAVTRTVETRPMTARTQWVTGTDRVPCGCVDCAWARGE